MVSLFLCAVLWRRQPKARRYSSHTLADGSKTTSKGDARPLCASLLFLGKTLTRRSTAKKQTPCPICCCANRHVPSVTIQSPNPSHTHDTFAAYAAQHRRTFVLRITHAPPTRGFEKGWRRVSKFIYQNNHTLLLSASYIFPSVTFSHRRPTWMCAAKDPPNTVAPDFARPGFWRQHQSTVSAEHRVNVFSVFCFRPSL